MSTDSYALCRPSRTLSALAPVCKEKLFDALQSDRARAITALTTFAIMYQRNRRLSTTLRSALRQSMRLVFVYKLYFPQDTHLNKQRLLCVFPLLSQTGVYSGVHNAEQQEPL